MIQKTYQPIDCSFHDIILDRITRKKIVTLAYYTLDGLQGQSTLLKDVYTKQKEEFLVFGDDKQIRLDQIKSIDGIALVQNASCTHHSKNTNES